MKRILYWLTPLILFSINSHAEYLGRVLYRQALDQIVVGYKIACLSQTPTTTATSFHESYRCRKLNNEETPLIQLEAEADLNQSKLLALNLIPLHPNLVLDVNETIVGEDILFRVLGTIGCEQISDLSYRCPRSGKPDLVIEVILNVENKPRYEKIIFKW